MLERLTWGGGREEMKQFVEQAPVLSSIYTRVVYHRFNISTFCIIREKMGGACRNIHNS